MKFNHYKIFYILIWDQFGYMELPFLKGFQMKRFSFPSALSERDI